MSMTVGDIQNLIAAFAGAASGSTSRYTPAELVFNNIDFTLLAMNNARRTVERVRDLFYAATDVTLSIASSGGNLDAATEVGNSTLVKVKKVQAVSVPISGGYLPIEFLSNDTYVERVRRQVGRTAYAAGNTATQYGITQTTPVAIQQGKVITLQPASGFTFPVSARLDVVRFLPDYEEPDESDFIMEACPEFLQWQGIVELNRLVKQFGLRPLEGDVAEPADLAAQAMQTLLAWDDSLRGGTTDLPATGAPPPVLQSRKE